MIAHGRKRDSVQSEPLFTIARYVRLLTVAQAAELLRLSPGNFVSFVSEKKIPVIKDSSRCIRFSGRPSYLARRLTQAAQPHQRKGVPRNAK